MTANSKEFYENAARRYQSQSVLVPGASHFRNLVLDRAMRKTVMPFLKRFRKLTILEIGCGVGRWTKTMSEENSVVGVDISKSMVRLAKSSCAGKDCSLVVADVAFLPFRENVFDLVVSITVLQHIMETKKFPIAIQEIARCTKSIALVVEEMWSAKEIVLQRVYSPIRILPLASYIRSMMAVGFRTTKVSGITPATLAILTTRLFTSKKNAVEGNFSYRLRSYKSISRIVHTIMGIGTLSAILLPSGNYNPSLSLHTMLVAEKQGAYIFPQECDTERQFSISYGA